MTDVCLPADDPDLRCLPDGTYADGHSSALREFAIVARVSHVFTYYTYSDISRGIEAVGHAGFDLVNVRTGTVIAHIDGGPQNGQFTRAIFLDDVPLVVGGVQQGPGATREILGKKTIVGNLTKAEALNLAQMGTSEADEIFGVSAEYQTIALYDRLSFETDRDVQNSKPHAGGGCCARPRGGGADPRADLRAGGTDGLARDAEGHSRRRPRRIRAFAR